MGRFTVDEGALPKLAPQLTYPSTDGFNAFTSVSAIDATSGLTTVVNASGRFALETLRLTGLPTSENVTIQLEIDGEMIWNDTFTPSTTNMNLLYTTTNYTSAFLVESSCIIRLQTITDTSINLSYMLRPIQ